MVKIHFICSKETIYNGRLYRPGQPWLPEDGGAPPPVGVGWSIREDNEPEPRPEGIVRWVPQPDRPRAQPLTEAEKEILEEDPYADIDEPASRAQEPEAAPPPAAPPPTAEELEERIKETRATYDRQLKTQEEIDDPYGLKAKAAARTAELKAGLLPQE